MNSKHSRADWLIRGATILNALASGALSFRATWSWAESSHLVPQPWGAVVPLVIEAGVLAAGGSAFRRRHFGHAIRLEMLFMASLLTLSMIIQQAAAAAEGATILARCVGALLPAILLFGVEVILRSEATAFAARVAAQEASDKPARAEMQRIARVDMRAAKLAAARTARSAKAGTDVTAETIDDATATRLHAVPAPPATDRNAIVAALVAQHGSGLTGAIVGEALGITASTGRRVLAQVRGRAVA